MRKNFGPPTTKLSPAGELYTHESVLQAACVRWFALKYPHLFDDLFAIPNAGKRGKTGPQMKAEGLKKGVLDLFLSVRQMGVGYIQGRPSGMILGGLFIEMKTPVGTISKDQKLFFARKVSTGYACAICRSIDEFTAVVEKYLSGTFSQSEHLCK